MKTKIKIKNLRSGERFEFCGFEWVLLGDEQSGKLAVMADIIDEYPFDKNNKNDWRKSNETFYLQTLARELNNADYNDLKQRSMALGLAPKDTAGEYRTQLAEYYGIKLISEKTYTGDKIILEHAGELKMIKLEHPKLSF